MQRYLKPLIVGVSLLASLILTVGRGGPNSPLGVIAQQRSSAAPDRTARKDYDLTALSVFTVVLGRVKDHYVEPTRIRPGDMMVAALNAIERNVAEVMVKESKDGKKVSIRVQDAERTFDIKSVDSPWALSSRMKAILRFMKSHLNPSTDLQEIEYAAINGMLSTLDPHSVVLKPELYNEMKLSTRGQFGGLGIVISMIQGVLTVMNPMKGTPAHTTGIKACDKILKIGEESTVNMTLTQAVNRLRGSPGSKVEITILRQGWSRPVRKVITRAIIKVDSVNSRMLAQKVGYVRLSSFQGNSTADLREHLRKLKRNGMRGLVLDLRNNPGGLLDQAIKISDLFIESGTLLTTVSHAGKQREEKRAKGEGTEGRFPIAVLVNSGSASASEIVAGALKHLDRAVIIGTRTFGKGSVQVLYDNDDGSALKLTIAQYLTPGDISIQSVGITPDIVTRPMAVREDFVRVRRQSLAHREEDLAKHLTSRNVRKGVKPLREVRYLAASRKRDKKVKKQKNLCLYPDRSCRPEEQDKFVEDFQVKLARSLLAKARGWRRTQVLASANAQGIFTRQEADQQRKLTEELKKLGVDWTVDAKSGDAAKAASEKTSPGKTAPGKTAPKNPELSVSVRGSRARACEEMKLRVTVKNTGRAAARRLMAVTKSDNRMLSGHEFVFGRLEPGQSRSWVVPLKFRDAPTRMDAVKLSFHDAAGTSYPPHSFQVSTRGVERPTFAYGYQLIDDEPGSNQDGRAQRGERLRLLVKVRNTGRGRALRAMMELKNLGGSGIFIHKGRFVFGSLAPGESKTASFTFTVQQSFVRAAFKLQLRVYDDGLGESVTDKLSFPVADAGDPPTQGKGTVRISVAKGHFRAWAGADAPAVGHAPRGAAFKVLGRVAGSWYRVAATKYRPAFISAKEVTPGGSVGGRTAFVTDWQVSPPKLTVKVPSHLTDAKSIRISGEATDETRVSDLFIFVRNPGAKVDGHKVFYRSNRHAKTPSRLRFSTDVPLWPGANYVTIFVRENEDVQARELVVVFRKKKDASPPKAAAR